MIRFALKITFVLIFSLGCNNIEKKFDQERDMIVGEWDVKEKMRQLQGGEIVFDFVQNFDVVLKKNGNGNELNILGTNLIEFEWIYQLNPKQIVFIDHLSGETSNSRIFDISELNESTMTWTTEYTIFVGNGEDLDVEIERIYSRK